MSKKTEQEKFERNQARVGLASNVLGLTAGVGALGTAVKDPRLAEGGPAARAAHRAGKVVPSPVGDAIERLHRKNPRRAKKIGAGLALGAVGLQAANTAGDVVANRVLSRESKVDKRMEMQSPGVVGRRIVEGEAVTKRVTTPWGVGRMASHARPTGLSQEQIQAQRWARKAKAGQTKMRNTTPSERVTSHKTSNRQIRARAKAADEARATRQAAGSTGIGRMEGASTASPAPTSGSRFTTKQKQSAALGSALVGGGGVMGYNLNKAETAQERRKRQQGMVVGAGAVGTPALAAQAARQFQVVPMTEPAESGPTGGRKQKVVGRAVTLKDAADRAKGKKTPPKVSSAKKAALYGAGALASGGAATLMARRSKKETARRWS